jgi:hypothetical protein
MEEVMVMATVVTVEEREQQQRRTGTSRMVHMEQADTVPVTLARDTERVTAVVQ